MVDFAEWESWLVPLVLLLLVYTAFGTQLNEIVTGVSEWAGGTFGPTLGAGEFKTVAFGLVILFIIIFGVSLAVYLHGTEPLTIKAISARMAIILVLFALAWLVNEVNAIVPLT